MPVSARQKVDHRLLAKPGTRLEDVTEVVSHEQALRQCSAFFASHPQIKATPMEPYHYGTVFHVLWVIHVEFQSFQGVGIRLFRITHVVDLSVGLCRCARNGQAEQQQGS